MQQILIVVHLVIVLALVGVILLQRSDSGALSGLGGGGGGLSGFMTGRGQANALTRATAILATCFFLTSIALAVLASSASKPRSVIDDAASKLPSQSAPAGGVLDQLKQIEQKAPTGPQVPNSR